MRVAQGVKNGWGGVNVGKVAETLTDDIVNRAADVRAARLD